MLFRYLLVLMFALQPVVVFAQAEDIEPVAFTPKLLISEVQTGGDTASEEFIELYNPTPEYLELDGFKVQYASSTLSRWSTKITLTGELSPFANIYFTTYEDDEATGEFSSGLAGGGGHLRIIYEYDDSLEPDVHDQLGWGMAVEPEGEVTAAPEAGSSIERQLDTQGHFIDTDNNLSDFEIMAVPSPLNDHIPGSIDDPQTPSEEEPVEPDPEAENPEEPSEEDPPDDLAEEDPAEEDEIPEEVTRLEDDTYVESILPLQLSELLPDPESPVPDSEGEYVEIYNPNDSQVEIAGLVIRTGSNYSYKHTFSSGTVIEPLNYVTVYSADTSLTLSNSGGAARLELPSGETWGSEVIYEKAEPGQSYSNFDGVWEWTEALTPDKPNILKRPVTVVKASTAGKKKASSTSSSGGGKFTRSTLALKAFEPLLINEIFPDPASPQTDAENEFVELYNPNDQPIVITGLVIEAGNTFNYSHTFTETTIAANGYVVVTSAESSLTLANAGSKVRLVLSDGSVWGSEVAYEGSQTGRSYSLLDGEYSWAEPTPGADNAAPEPSTEESDQESAGTFETEYTSPPELAGSSPSWLMVGGFTGATVLYSGYEYRQDIANRFIKSRRNRSNRS